MRCVRVGKAARLGTLGGGEGGGGQRTILEIRGNFFYMKTGKNLLGQNQKVMYTEFVMDHV